MKSKISFFNRTIFRKNVTLFWPIWAIYLVTLLLMVPGSLWLHLRTHAAVRSEGLQFLASSLNLTAGMIGIMVMVLVTGVALHNYLFVSRNANMIHALPVSRLELFGTNLASGLSFLLIPQLLAFFAGVLVCLGHGQTRVEYLGSWLLVMMGVTVIMYGMVEFCAMITGQLWALPLFYVLINSAYLVLKIVVEAVVISFSYGGIELGSLDGKGGEWLSPAYYLLCNVRFVPQYVVSSNSNNNAVSYVCNGLTLEGGPLVARYLLFSLLFYVVAWRFYKKRHLEKAGDFITVTFVKPIFRWGFGFVLGFLVALWGGELLQEFGYERSTAAVIGMAVIFGGIFFCFADMLVKKTFRIFKKQMFAEAAVFGMCMLLWGLGMQYYAKQQTRLVPPEEDIAEAAVEYHYPIAYRGEEISKVTRLHRAAIDQALKAAEHEDFEYLAIVYKMNDGSVLQRLYPVAPEELDDDIVRFLLEAEEDAGNFLRYLLMEDYENVERYTGGSLISEVGYDYEYDVTEFSTEQVRKLVEAVIADAEEGVLQKYNIYTSEEYGGVYFAGYLELNYTLSPSESRDSYDFYYAQEGIDNIWDELMGYGYVEEMYSYGEYRNGIVYFGKDCTHILYALKELGIIKSEADLHFYEERAE